MPEPITLLGIALTSQVATDTIGTIVGGILGNRSDTLFCNAYRTVYDRLKNQSEPVNRDIQRAVREAYLKATLLACERLLYQKYNWIDRRFHFPTYDLKEVIGYLKKQLKQLKTARFVTQTNPADAEYVRLLQPNGQTAQERTGELKQQLRESLLRELAAANLCVEDDLKAAILSGWTDDEGRRVDWYGLLCAFFAEDLKTNTRLNTVIQTELLLGLQKQVPDVGWSVKLLEQQATQIGEAMQPFVEQFDELMTRLDQMLDLLVQMDKKVDRVQETVEEGDAFNRDSLTGLHEKVDKLQPKTPARAKYLNTFARYDLQNLVGRETQLQAIDAHLNSHNLLLLRGMGGIGKTTLARAYLARMEAQFDHVAFLEITSTIADGMVLYLGGSPDITFIQNPTKSTEENFNALLGVLRRIPNTLLIIDNANDADDLLLRKKAFDSLPWKVLITSRAKVHTYQQEQKVQEIKQLMPDEAQTLFMKLYGLPLTDDDNELVKNILEKAFYHPKLIEVLAKAARENPLLELETLREIVVNKEYGDEEINYPVEIGEEEKPVYRILLDLFNTDHLNDDLKQILRYFAVLPTIDIPFEHMTELLKAEDATARKSLFEKLKKLTRSGWLDDLDNRYFSMHGLVQWVMCERLQPALENCRFVLNNLGWILNHELESNTLKGEKLMPYATKLLAVFDNTVDLSIERILTNTSQTYRMLGALSESLKYSLKATSMAEKIYPADHISLSGSYGNLSLIYRELGDYNNQLKYAIMSLQIAENSLPLNYMALARAYGNVAGAYAELHKYKKQLHYNLRALKIREQLPGPSGLDLARAYSNIALTYRSLEQYNTELKYNLKALHIREQALPSNHPMLALSYANIAGTHDNLGDLHTGMGYHLKALTIREEVLPHDHPDIARSYHNVAYAYLALDKVSQAYYYIQKAVAMQERVLPLTHPDLLSSRRGLEIIEQNMRAQYKQAG